MALYVVALSIARKMKLHTIREQIDKSTAIDTVKLIYDDDLALKLQSVLWSNNTVKSHIANLSLNIIDKVMMA